MFQSLNPRSNRPRNPRGASPPRLRNLIETTMKYGNLCAMCYQCEVPNKIHMEHMEARQVP